MTPANDAARHHGLQVSWQLADPERAEYQRLWAHVEPVKARDILIGSLVAFAQRGYHAATTRDIADEVGMSPAGVYVHFRSKEAVLVELITRGHQAILDRVTEAVTGIEDPLSAVRRWAESWTEGHARLHTLARVVQHELNSVPPEHQRDILHLRGRLTEMLEDPIAAGVRQGTFAVPDVHGAARAIISLGIDVARWYSLEPGVDPHELGRQHGEYAVRMLVA